MTMWDDGSRASCETFGARSTFEECGSQARLTEHARTIRVVNAHSALASTARIDRRRGAVVSEERSLQGGRTASTTCMYHHTARFDVNRFKFV